ncbi:GPCR fungal pheromone mating factor [Hygrophoropsis aurantiaca]|uniref:GPCR fungal pheromone mating factor n=1 Tax=Hygrophoropsis aurantiaca TaxID=72124 RepID=A0ACB8AFV0_9AGAM|nr:GPCR fungal pheromone mating factor [Hygrophoropsis aurantiaca]
MPMEYPALPFGAFLGAALVLIPLPWHWRARNIGTLAIIAWLFIMNMIYGINSIIWAGNVNNYIPVWCDITTKLIIGANTALPIATMCVCKHLELVSSNRRVRIDNIDKRRRIIFDSIMCFGVPLIFMALHYVVQGHRYDIIENFGCQPATYYSVPAVMIVWFPPLFFSVVTLGYASASLYHFVRRRISFAAHLQNSNSALTTHRYMRLMAMAVTEIVWGTALTSFNIYNNIQGGLRPWISWDNVHSNFSRVDLYIILEIPPAYLQTMLLFWWAMPVSAYIFFMFFGFGEEARKEYSNIITLFRRYVLRQTIQDNTVFGSSFPNSR